MEEPGVDRGVGAHVSIVAPGSDDFHRLRSPGWAQASASPGGVTHVLARQTISNPGSLVIGRLDAFASIEMLVDASVAPSRLLVRYRPARPGVLDPYLVQELDDVVTFGSQNGSFPGRRLRLASSGVLTWSETSGRRPMEGGHEKRGRAIPPAAEPASSRRGLQRQRPFLFDLILVSKTGLARSRRTDRACSGGTDSRARAPSHLRRQCQTCLTAPGLFRRGVHQMCTKFVGAKGPRLVASEQPWAHRIASIWSSRPYARTSVRASMRLRHRTRTSSSPWR